MVAGRRGRLSLHDLFRPFHTWVRSSMSPQVLLNTINASVGNTTWPPDCRFMDSHSQNYPVSATIDTHALHKVINVSVKNNRLPWVLHSGFLLELLHIHYQSLANPQHNETIFSSLDNNTEIAH